MDPGKSTQKRGPVAEANTVHLSVQGIEFLTTPGPSRPESNKLGGSAQMRFAEVSTVHLPVPGI